MSGKTRKRGFRAFSLAEMMVVMLILTIALAASLPIMTKQQHAVQTATAGSAPTGAIMQYAVATPPSGWLLCNGQSTSGHPALAALVGANVPDSTGRVAVGASGSLPLNTTGGEVSHTLTLAEMPSHNHGGHTDTQGNHSHLMPYKHASTEAGGFGVDYAGGGVKID